MTQITQLLRSAKPTLKVLAEPQQANFEARFCSDLSLGNTNITKILKTRVYTGTIYSITDRKITAKYISSIYVGFARQAVGELE